jgi:RHS repeat-associated protein
MPAIAALIDRTYTHTLAGLAANPATAVARLGHIVRYLSTYRALVDTPHGRRVAISTVPLRVHAGTGREIPVNLSIRRAGAAFDVRAPVTPTTISLDASDGIDVGTPGAHLSLVGANVQGDPINGSSVLFPNVLRDVDALATPTIRGGDLAALVRSAASPRSLHFRLRLPSSLVATMQADGVIGITREGKEVADIPVPQARDAQDRPIPVTSVLHGDAIDITIARGEELDYPVLVDPEIVDITESDSNWHFHAEEHECQEPEHVAGSPPGADSPMAITFAKESFPRYLYPLCDESPASNGSESAGWEWTGDAGAPFEAEFDDVHVSVNTRLAGGTEDPEGGYWYIGAQNGDCGAGHSGFADEPPEGFFVLPKVEGCVGEETATDHVLVELSIGDQGAVGERSSEGSLSVGAILISAPWPKIEEAEEYGEENKSTPEKHRCFLGGPVNCATGNQVVTQTDLKVGGRGPALEWKRTYNSELAANQTRRGAGSGPLGYGWSDNYSAHVEVSYEVAGHELGHALVTQSDGSVVAFVHHPGGAWEPTGALVRSSFAVEEDGYVYTLPDREKLYFDIEGALDREVDRNGNAVTLDYKRLDGRLVLSSAKDSAGRELSLTYSGCCEITSVTGPLGRTVKYTYGHDGEDLATATEPGAASAGWQFEYDSENELTKETDGRGDSLQTKYFPDAQVESQTDALGRTRTWEYRSSGGSSTETRIIEPAGTTTLESFNAQGLPLSVTHGLGTPQVATTEYRYGVQNDLKTVIDPDGHDTHYDYDAAGDRTAETNADGDETKWEYNSYGEVTGTTAPSGERMGEERNADGDIVKVTHLGSGGAKEITQYKYDSQGDLESTIDPEGAEWTYAYDTAGDRIAEITPSGAKKTWTYNEASEVVGSTTPRGNEPGADAAKYTTIYEPDAQGRITAVTRPAATGVGAPLDETPPTVSGMLQEGQTLTAQAGLWNGAPTLTYAYRWEACDALGEGCFAVPGASEATLALSSEAVGYTIRVSVTATNSLGSSTRTSATTRMITVGPPPVFVSSFGSEGGGEGQFYRPMGVAVDAHGDVWVADAYGSRIEKFSSSGGWIATYGHFGSGEGEFEEPIGIAINQNTHNVYIADQNNNRVDELNESGDWVRSWTGGEGDFQEPGGIAVDSEGNVWVTDYGNDRVEEFTEAGGFEKAFGKAGSEGGEFNGPSGVVAANGLVYVTDLNNARLEGFNEDGEYEGETGGWGFGVGGFMFPAGLAADSAGHIVVADLGNDRIQELGEYGNFISAFGSPGVGAGQLSEPEQVAVSNTGAIYVSDSGNARIEKWQPATAPTDSTTPSISGESLVGQTITAGSGIWSAAESPSYSYQWERCDRKGEGCANIPGATSVAYTIAGSDLGARLRVSVTASSSDGDATGLSTVTHEIAGARTTKYEYDAAGNLTGITDPSGAATGYAYDSDNELTKIEEPDGVATETGYDAGGRVIRQTNGRDATTEYVRDPLGRVTEVIDPDKRSATKEYDAAGNLIKVKDPEGRTTEYTYDAADRLTEVTYPGGSTPTVKYEYDANGDRIKMIDGTGSSTYAYDQFGQLSESENGYGEVIKYGYNLDGAVTTITYPNGKAVTRAYNSDDQLERVSDWNENTTKFRYDADGSLVAVEYPGSTDDHDSYSYNEADEPIEASMTKGTETLASIAYGRDGEGRIAAETARDLPGVETSEYAYDSSSRLIVDNATSYGYDDANDLTAAGSGEYKYDGAGQLESGPAASYAYSEDGQRIRTKPTSGPEVSYEYDQAGNLTAVSRPSSGGVTAINDTYGYNGNGLRTAETVDGTTNHLVWEEAEGLPELLDNGTYSFVYGPDGSPVEQINNTTGTVTYLHHDQAGSTRLLTGSTGKVEGKCSYSAYGTPTCEGTATTPLGWDGQYTSSDTGLIYLRNRVYDPSTAQVLTVDPLVGTTRAPYTYAEDNPVNAGDPTGLSSWNPFSESFWTEGNFISESPLNPIPYYEKEIESYENGCGYFASVAHGLEGAVVGALDASGAGEEAAGADAADAAATDGADVIFGHGARHLVGTALDSGEVESAISSQIEQSAARASSTGSFWGRTVVDGQTVEYRAYTLPNGSINIGTYYVVP